MKAGSISRTPIRWSSTRSKCSASPRLYQLRGRIGRAKQRAYAYLTYGHDKKRPEAAEQRLHAIEQLDSLGAGFQLASHDLDISRSGQPAGRGTVRPYPRDRRGALPTDAGRSASPLRARASRKWRSSDYWAPPSTSVWRSLFPEGEGIPDLNLRLSIYRRIAAAQTENEIEGFAAELIRPFRPAAEETSKTCSISSKSSSLCRKAGVERVDEGRRGAVFRSISSCKIDIQKLVKYIQGQTGTAKNTPRRPDTRLRARGTDLPVRKEVFARS